MPIHLISMRADLLQTVALGCFGNMFLALKSEKAPELLHSNVAFRGISEVTFERGSEGLMKGRIAENIAPWLNRIAREGTTKFRLIYDDLPISPRQAPKIWGLLTDGDIGMEIWTPTWHPKAMFIGEPKACRVLYTAYRSTRFFIKPVSQFQDDLVEIETALGEIVGELSMILPEHANRILACYQDYVNRSMTAFGLELCFPQQMDPEATAIGILGIKIASAVSAADWDTGLARRGAGDKLDTFTNNLWAVSLKCFGSAIDNANSHLLAQVA